MPTWVSANVKSWMRIKCLFVIRKITSQTYRYIYNSFCRKRLLYVHFMLSEPCFINEGKLGRLWPRHMFIIWALSTCIWKGSFCTTGQQPGENCKLALGNKHGIRLHTQLNRQPVPHGIPRVPHSRSGRNITQRKWGWGVVLRDHRAMNGCFKCCAVLWWNRDHISRYSVSDTAGISSRGVYTSVS